MNIKNNFLKEKIRTTKGTLKEEVKQFNVSKFGSVHQPKKKQEK